MNETAEARLTVEPSYIHEGWTTYTVVCSHGKSELHVTPQETYSFASPAECVKQVTKDHDLTYSGCHCADAIRARYGAGGEPSRG